MKFTYWLAGTVLFLLVIGGVFVESGAYNVAADDPHWPLTHSVLGELRNRSIARRSGDIAVPPLDDDPQIRQGAGNYDAMCAGCHLKPGLESSELSRGLYPAPPNLVEHPADVPAAAFWTIKHGIKMSAMPAWGGHMADEYIWGIVAFLKRLPALTPDEYHELVEASGGHHHGGGESDEHEEQEEHEHDEQSGSHDDAGTAPHAH